MTLRTPGISFIERAADGAPVIVDSDGGRYLVRLVDGKIVLQPAIALRHQDPLHLKAPYRECCRCWQGRPYQVSVHGLDRPTDTVWPRCFG